MSPDLREEIEFELGRLARSLRDAEADLAKLAAHGPDDPPRTWDMRAAATVLHECHNGVENILKRAAKHIDRKLPQGDSWHRDLLDQMANATPKRPALVSPVLHKALGATLGFRHVARTKYGFDLEWPKLRELLIDLPAVMSLFSAECRAFLDAFESK